MSDTRSGSLSTIDSLRTSVPAPTAGGAMMKAEGDRAIAEVQAALVIAKRFPRDEDAAYAKIMKACKRPALAEAALYAYTKGGSEVSGPSIRLAEELARDWGNITFGWRVLSADDDSSEVRAEAWDLETNVPAYIVFTVRHEFKGRDGGQKVLKKVTDPREIYELVANQASRRLRACVLRVIPGDVQDAAVEQCEKTLKEGGGKPLGDRVRDMLAAFKNDFGVTKEMIEKRVGKNAEAINETELLALRRVFVSLRDGMEKVEAFFDLQTPDQVVGAGTNVKDLKSATGGASAGTAPPAQERAVAPPPVAEPEKKVVQQPKQFNVTNERGLVLTTLAYEPTIGEILEIDGFKWRIFEVTDRAVARTYTPPAEPKPQPKAEAPADGVELELQAFMNEVMAADNVEELKEAEALIPRLAEKDRANAKSLVETKRAHLSKPKPARKRPGIE